MTTTRTRTTTVTPLEDGGSQTIEEASLSSVTLAVNTKGQVQPEIKVYNADPHAAYAIAKAILEQARKDGLVPEVKP
mgnify:CR=1 FL=1